MFAVVLLLAQSLVTAVDVRITTLDGVTTDASLTKIEAGELVVQEGNATQRRPLSEVLEVARIDAPAELLPTTSVELLNGTRLTATAIKIDGGQLTVSLVRQQALQVPLKQVRWIRFRAPSTAIDPQWLGMTEKTPSSDTLVIRRAGDSLDEASGIVKSADEKTVKFDLDGDELDAPIEKLEGIVFANPLPAVNDAKVSVQDTHGSRFRVRTISGDADGNVLLELSETLKHRFPLDQLLKIESTGSLQFLATVTPVETSFQAVSNVGLSPELAKAWFAPQASNERDIQLTGEAAVEYRLEEGFTSLQGSAEWDEEVKAGGKCVLRILLDNKVVWEQTFDVTAPEPRGFDLPIGKAKRVRFELKTGSDGDVGDHLRILQPRLVK